MSGEESERPILLHGTLDLNVLGARSLPNMDLVSERVRRVFSVFNVCKAPSKSEGKSSHHRSKIITSDPYVTVCLGGATVARTRVISNSQEPLWNEHFKIPIAHFVSKVEFHVKDNDLFGAELIGIASVNAELLKGGEPVIDWFPVYGTYGKTHKPDSAINLEMRFVPCENNPFYMYGMATNPDNFGVRESYFPVRRGGSVTLYQDAHVPKGMLPKIELDDSKFFKQEPCWEDICHAILEAHHMVYIVGWSIYDKVKLVREATKPLPSGGNLTLGELLKYKSQEGVRVLLLVWDDKTSHDKLFFKTVS